MKFTGKWLQFLTFTLILVTVVGLLHVALAKTYIARNVLAYEKIWHTDGSVTLLVIKRGHDFAYHTNLESHKHADAIFQITLKNVLCRLRECLTCNPTNRR